MHQDLEINLKTVKDKLAPYSCTLVAVSKRKPNSDIQAAYDLGHLDFGENQVQELLNKVGHLPQDIRWHMIGHLQRNKVKNLVDFIHLIHSVDSLRLLKEIEKQAEKVSRVVDCLLQVHIAEEDEKFGLSPDELEAVLTSPEVELMKYVRVVGLMGMATNTEDREKIKREFKSLKVLFDQLKERDLGQNIEIREISMGMTGDYEIALEEGSSMVRIGSAIFGPREY